MNFLAHLLLAGDDVNADAQTRLGAILPDLVRGPLPRDLPPAVQTAADRHRRIDKLTDLNPHFLASRQRLAHVDARLRGIAVDVLYDHLLSSAWDDHCAQPLPVFIADVHGDLHQTRHLAPPAARPIIDRLIEHNWLTAYATDAGLATIFKQMSARLTHRVHRPLDLAPAMHDLVLHRDALADDFNQFFPQLRDAINNKDARAAGSRLL